MSKKKRFIFKIAFILDGIIVSLFIFMSINSILKSEELKLGNFHKDLAIYMEAISYDIGKRSNKYLVQIREKDEENKKVVYNHTTNISVSIFLNLYRSVAKAQNVYSSGKNFIQEYQKESIYPYIETNFKEQLRTADYAENEVKLNKNLLNLFARKQLENKIKERVGKEEGEFTIYIKDLTDKEVIEFGRFRKYPPASTFKVYTAILTLKNIEDGNLYWSSGVTLSKALWSPGPGTWFEKEDLGKVFSAQNLLWRMIVQSDNTAQSMLFALNGRANIENRLESELNLENTSLKEFHTTNRDMAYALENLYYRNYLNDYNSQYLLNLMINGYARDRIKAGLPSGVKAANKGGTLETSKHDVAIVFGNNTDYVLVVYSDDIIEQNAVNTIKDVSSLVWEYMENKQYEEKEEKVMENKSEN
ncbi:hypothetical protein GF362_07490 [Candidatus Dojkabacteria bacterium]|nr:hypothetical protein [Candidatus Dojkabacteria bacterium]